MRKYLLLHSKRMLRMLPFVLVVTAILFGSLATAFVVLREIGENDGLKAKFRIGVVGTADNRYLQMGLAAVESMDSSRLTMELIPMSEESAQQAMLSRNLSAYIVFPEGFMDAALSGDMIPLKYVSTNGVVSIVTLVKDEITQVVESILFEAQKGTYGVGDAMSANGMAGISGDHVNQMAIEYVELVLDRGKIYTAEELGIYGGLDMNGYLLSSLSVVFLAMVCMPYAPMMIRDDRTMERLLAGRSIGPLKQIGAEFAVYFCSIFLLLGLIFSLILPMGILSAYHLTWVAVPKAIPAILMIAAWSFLLYEISRNFISGVLLQFVSALCLTYISGCLYPISFFPESVQAIGNILPTGAARIQLANCLVGANNPGNTWLLLGYSACFMALAVILRSCCIRGNRR